MFVLVDSNNVPILDSYGCLLSAISLDEAAGLLSRHPDGAIIDIETGLVVQPAALATTNATEACEP